MNQILRWGCLSAALCATPVAAITIVDFEEPLSAGLTAMIGSSTVFDTCFRCLPAVLELDFDGIHRVTLEGHYTIGFDDLTFSEIKTVPEPSGFLLMGAALAALRFRRTFSH